MKVFRQGHLTRRNQSVGQPPFPFSHSERLEQRLALVTTSLGGVNTIWFNDGQDRMTRVSPGLPASVLQAYVKRFALVKVRGIGLLA